MSRRQSLADRSKRFGEGCCPIHGLFMSQIDRWYYPEDREPYTIVGCPRRECNAQAMAESYDGPWEIMPDCAYLLDEVLPPSILTTASRPKKVSWAPKPKKPAVWSKTEGKCYYCGLQLNWNTTFTKDHVVPTARNGLDTIENTVPACRSCNSTKGMKDLVEFKFFKMMQKFEEQNGVTFTSAQVEYLNSIGVELDIPPYTFWFEQQ